jgi:hypothetical protein
MARNASCDERKQVAIVDNYHDSRVDNYNASTSDCVTTILGSSTRGQDRARARSTLPSSTFARLRSNSPWPWGRGIVAPANHLQTSCAGELSSSCFQPPSLLVYPTVYLGSFNLMYCLTDISMTIPIQFKRYLALVMSYSDVRNELLIDVTPAPSSQHSWIRCLLLQA